MKSLIFTLASILSSQAIANDQSTVATNNMLAQDCPSDFYSLPLFPESHLCQMFAQSLPATLTYHAKSDLQSTHAFYQQQLGQADSDNTFKGRIVMHYAQGEQIIIISPDGEGSQVDILVKRDPVL